MSCGPGEPTFRLLDGYVGWDVAATSGLTGLRDPAGLRLARLGGDPDAPTRRELLPWFPDPRLAPAPEGGWFLATPGGVLRRGPDGAWRPVWTPGCDPEPPVRATLLASHGHWLAAADRDRVRVWWREGEQLTAVIRVRGGVRALAVDHRGGTVLATGHGTELWRFGPDGRPRGRFRTGLSGTIEGLRFGTRGRLHVLTDEHGTLRLWTLTRGRPRPATVGALGPGTALTDAWAGGFCLGEAGCHDWHGCPTGGPPPAAPSVHRHGELRTTGIDSGIPRCRWHRVTVDADVPDGCAVHLAVAVTEETDSDGVVVEPDDGDWQLAPAGATDFLIDAPPGRYLLLRLALTGDGTATPVVRRVRLDLPRHTSADLLPAAYLADPAAEDFTERFLSLFDVELAGIDRVLDRYPALLDPAGVPDEALPWLGGLLGFAFEAGWSPAVRRELLAAAPGLFRRRGTPGALRDVIRVVTGADPVITDLAAERAWLPLSDGGVRLGAGRLFGRSAARFRLGTSPLGGAPLRSHGDPATDPLTEAAYRFRVSLPAGAAPVETAAVERLIAAHAPAHTAGTVHRGGLGWVVGVRSTVGVDTAFVPLPETTVGTPLDRGTVLAPSRRGVRRGIAVGGTAGAATW
ncbi:phage tail-like protein [Catenuloplanes nepalensis]|uniref:Phage tail-like protein n=1 Tax=Catenuloplanes nepalensis TaxID=587533 RepID=A0ABT9MP39_9ACTN|nr:phage tail protein [Catenuloplanes nepalensis]MDP9793185.1 phage tail-like protein [Catenuloplanes nepalensis]